MPEDVTTGTDWTCDLCGRSVATTPEGPEGMTVEVAGRGPDGEWSFWDAGFCSQEHAAEWLGRPLPRPHVDDPVPQRPWTERAVPVVLVFCLLWSLALMAIGAWTAVQFVLDRT